MDQKKLITLFALSLTACSGSSLAPRTNQQFTVSSTPSGAAVYVMGEQAGVTPLTLDAKQVFPNTYSQEQEQHYGRIVLKHEGCKDQIIGINSGRLSDGIVAKLECPKMAAAKEQVAQESPAQTETTVKPSSAKERLKQLDDLKQEGLITEQEYRKIRQEVLDSL